MNLARTWSVAVHTSRLLYRSWRFWILGVLAIILSIFILSICHFVFFDFDPLLRGVGTRRRDSRRSLGERARQRSRASPSHSRSADDR